VGGGFSGLTVAYELQRQGFAIRLYESSDRLGGLLGTLRPTWGLVETAANGFLMTGPLRKLCDDLHVSLVEARRETKRRYIFTDRPRRLPIGPWSLLRAVYGLVRPTVPQPGESAQTCADRAFGSEFSRVVFEPVCLGIFGTTLDNLSATLVRNYFFKRPTKNSKQKKVLYSPVGGMQDLIDALEKAIRDGGGQIFLNRAVTPNDLQEMQTVVLAVPAPLAGTLIGQKSPVFSKRLQDLRYLPLTTVTLALGKRPKGISGFGCLFPKASQFFSLGVLFNDDIFPGRGPAWTETYICPGSDQNDDDLLNQIFKDRKRVFAESRPEDLQDYQVTRWPQALPQYGLELEALLKERPLISGVFLSGNYLGEIGLSRIYDQSVNLALSISQSHST